MVEIVGSWMEKVVGELKEAKSGLGGWNHQFSESKDQFELG